MRRIVVSLRSCPTRLLGPYGCEWIDTPNFDRFAAQSVVFDSCWASHVDRKSPVPSYVETLKGFDSNVWKQAFERLDTSENAAISLEFDPFSLPWGDWPEGAIDLGNEEVQEPFFEQVEQVVANFDSQIGDFLEEFGKQEFADTTLMAFTARIGLPVGEHGLLGLSESRLHRELLQLPLVLRFPGQQSAGDRVEGMITDLDFATVLRSDNCGEWLKFVTDSKVGKSEVFSTLGEPVREAVIRTHDSCLIQSLADAESPPLLFDLPDDRFEINDVGSRQLDRTEELGSRLVHWLKSER